jgi:hypothetical protein
MAAAKKSTTVRAPLPTQTAAAPPQQAAPVQQFAVPPVSPPAVVVKPPAGRAVAIGRDGQPIWRHTSGLVTDNYAIDPALVPPGWVYEWKRYSVMGSVDHSYHAQLARVGWTPVLASVHDGVFLPPGTTGAIIRDGLILMERPMELHEEAQAEVKRAATDVMRKARSERGLQVPAGTAGVSTQTPEARGASYVNESRVFANKEDMEALSQIPKAAYEYERNTID